METDRNLLFGSLALQVGLIDEGKLGSACRNWLARRDVALSFVLIEMGLISEEEAAGLERLIETRIQGGDSGTDTSHVLVAEDEVRRSLEALGDLEGDTRHSSREPSETAQDEAERAGLEPPGRGRYTLTKLHASGGLGQVWLARDAALGREVALKELLPTRVDNPVLRERFLQEARITGQLEHPGIVPVHEVVPASAGSPPYYTMRFVRGRTLWEAIRHYHAEAEKGAAGPLEFRALINAFVAVCNAVAYAHARGVIHRDLKGQNVVLGDFGEVVLLDWGLAKFVDPDGDAAEVRGPRADRPKTNGGSGPEIAMGTPAYMAPEQAEGGEDQVDRRTDVYGLGAILYSILTGSHPFRGSSLTELFRQVREELPPRPRAVRPSADPALEAVCWKALAKDPEARYPSAVALANEVERWLAGEPVEAWIEPWTVRRRRWLSRHRTFVSATGAATFVAVTSLMLATVLLAYSRTKERDAKRQAQRQELRARDQETKARENFDLAQRAVDDYLNIVGESLLLRQPGLQPLRERLLRAGLGYFQKLARERSDDPSLQADLARALLRMGMITEDIGSKLEALRAYQNARATLERLSAERPGDARLQELLAESLNRLGNLQGALGRTEEALHSLHAARSIIAWLTQVAPTTADYRNRLAGIDNNIGNMLRDSGRGDDALLAYKRARDTFGLLARDPSEPDDARRGEYRANLAGINQNMGVLQQVSGRHDEAKTSLERARDIRRDLIMRTPNEPSLLRAQARGLNDLGSLHWELGEYAQAATAQSMARDIQRLIVAANPAMTDYQHDLAGTLNLLGDLARAAGRDDEALRLHSEARGFLQRLVDADPAVGRIRNDLATSLHRLAVLHADAGRIEEALDGFERARKILEELVREAPGETRFRRDLADVMNGAGNVLNGSGRPAEALELHRDARAILEDLLRTGPTSTGVRAALAQTYSHLGLAQQGLGRPAEAKRAHEKARGLLEPLADESPRAAPFRRELANCLQNIAVLDRRAGRTDLALESARRAVALFEALAVAEPGVGQSQRDLVVALDNLGDLAREAGRPDEALRRLTRARTLQQERLHDGSRDHAENPGDRSLLGLVLGHLGLVRARQGDMAGAVEITREAAECQRGAHTAAPRVIEYRRLLSGHYGQLARLHRMMIRPAEAEAVSLLRRDLAAAAHDPEALVEAARDLALCIPPISAEEWENLLEETGKEKERDGRRKRLTALAWDALREAVAAGYTDYSILRTHPDLAGLRADAAVAAWLGSLEAGNATTPGVERRGTD